MNSRCVMMRIRTPSFESRRSVCGAPAIGGSFKNSSRCMTANLCSAS